MIKRALVGSNRPNPSFVGSTRIMQLNVDTGPLPLTLVEAVQCCAPTHERGHKHGRKHRRHRH